MAGQQLDAQLVEGGADRGDLGEDVDTVLVLLDHALDTAHLPGDPVQALGQLPARLVGGCRGIRRRRDGFHEPHIPPGGIFVKAKADEGTDPQRRGSVPVDTSPAWSGRGLIPCEALIPPAPFPQ